jgi:hypothetical protein
MSRPIAAAFLLGLAAVSGGGCRGRRDPAPFVVPPPEMRESGYRVAWQSRDFPPSVAASSKTMARIVFRNSGTEIWHGSVHAARYFVPEGAPLKEGRDDAPRLTLRRPVAPGQTVTLERFEVAAPARPGRYRLVFDLVNEGVAWFSDRGAPPCAIPVRVD